MVSKVSALGISTAEVTFKFSNASSSFNSLSASKSSSALKSVGVNLSLMASYFS
jgi:hypothetical protein